MAAKNAVWHLPDNWDVGGAENSALARQTAVEDPGCHRPVLRGVDRVYEFGVYTVLVLELI